MELNELINYLGSGKKITDYFEIQKILNEILRHFKSQTALAEALYITPAAISDWKNNGFPVRRQYEIKELLKTKPKKPKKHKEYLTGWNWE